LRERRALPLLAPPRPRADRPQRQRGRQWRNPLLLRQRLRPRRRSRRQRRTL